MSGHSKWSTIKRQKATADTKRSGLFTKLSHAIAVSAREGADPDMNFKLRIAIDKAKSFSMPKDNIERAIARGAGTDETAQLETVLYEGFGPDGVACIIETITDNKNRTVSEIKHVFTKHGGNLGGSGSVMWMFERRGLITIMESSINETQELSLIDAGLVDTQKDDGKTILIVGVEKLQKAAEAAKQNGLTVEETGIGYVPKERVHTPSEDKIIALLDALGDLDDVDNVYVNADI